MDGVKPPPSQRRPAGVLVYDGDCGFCTSCVRWMERTLPAPPDCAPYQWADLDTIGLGVDEASERVWYLLPGHHYGGHLAVSAVLRSQPSTGWRFLGRLLIVPPISWAAAIGYALTARFRYLLPGGTPACRVGPGL